MRKPMMFCRRLVLLGCASALAGCVSLGGGEPPSSLLTLTAEASVPPGSAHIGTQADTLAVHVPETSASIDVLRIPVQVDDATIAYVTDAVWVEKPARLFRRVVAETIRAETGQFVIDGDDPSLFADIHLRGTLREFGYDARSSSVVVRFDAIRTGEGGMVETRRFEAVEQGILAQAAPVSSALNRAANDVARQVAAWLSETPDPGP
ncbi:ABC-type transport auxiliary lipoprotein family protein [Altererythrobacter sp. GH1-8]|uniref:ABC-type transport auxiliary lipoprotein family protein n=1 Tax=Altererythrobacter sp. GH1-8 TaxID=3349333 RepID=UPI00374DF241